MNYTDLTAKNVIDINTLEHYGTPQKIYLNRNLFITGFSTAYGNFVSIDRVTAINDFIAVQGDDAPLRTEPDIALPPLGSTIVDTDGKILDKMNEYLFTKDFKLKLIAAENRNYSPLRILKIGKENILIKGKNRTKTDTKRAQNTNSGLPRQSNAPGDYERAAIVANYEFLVGRRVLRDIKKHDIIVARENNIVDEAMIKLASAYGKLVELTIYSVK